VVARRRLQRLVQRARCPLRPPRRRLRLRVASRPAALGLIVALVVHLLVIGWMWRDLAAAGPDPAFGPTGAFLHTAVVWTVIAAFVATVPTLGPPLLLTICM
jgi:hypothetical protein